MKIDTQNMQIYDISMPVHYSMPVYNGKESKRPVLKVVSDHNTSKVHESEITMNLHTGTHLDRSLHMIPGGTTVESLNLNQVVAPCTVIDLTQVKESIGEKDLIGKDIRENYFVILKTRNSFEDILENEFVFVNKTGAQFLKEKGIIGVGIDSLGIERTQPEHETHINLLGNDIVILEGLRLKDISEGEYLLSAAPILINGGEGAPVRAYLMK